MKTRYRIVTDSYCGFEVQYRPWWCPIWLQAGARGGWGVNTCTSIEMARNIIARHKASGVVVHVE